MSETLKKVQARLLQHETAIGSHSGAAMLNMDHLRDAIDIGLTFVKVAQEQAKQIDELKAEVAALKGQQ